jgi:hypothetical protein
MTEKLIKSVMKAVKGYIANDRGWSRDYMEDIVDSVDDYKKRKRIGDKKRNKAFRELIETANIQED